MVPVYFFPGPESSTISTPAIMDLVRAAGLESVIGDFVQAGRVSTSAITNGPDKGPGWTVCQEPTTAGYYEQEQEWFHIKPKGYWLGIRNGSPPTPKDLQRGETLHEDYKIKLNDGNDWSIMAITPFRRPGAMPRIGSMGDDCQWSWEPDGRYKALTARYEALWNGGQDNFPDLAVATLQVNYRIDVYLAMCLKLFHLADCERIIDFAMDDPEIKKWRDSQEGNARPSAGLGMTAGGGTPVASPDLVLPSPI